MTALTTGQAQDGSGDALRFDREIDLTVDNVHTKILQQVGSGRRVLELGCATGHMTRVLRDRGCQVVGIELDPSAAERAAAFCERVIVGDLEQLELADQLGEDRFDVVIAADILERLKDPLLVLRGLKTYLRQEGYIVASIPNVAHGSVRLALLSGHFPYGDWGLLDRTRLRFYTRQSMEKLFEDAGYAIGYLDRQEMAIDASEVPYDRASVPPGLLDVLSQDPEALTYQFIVVAHPLPWTDRGWQEGPIGAFDEGVEAAQREVTRLRQTVREQAEHLDALGARVQFLSRREAELQGMLYEVHAQLLERDQLIDSRVTKLLEREQLIESGETQLHLEVARLTAEIEFMRATRAWKLGEGYVRARDRVKGWLRLHE